MQPHIPIPKEITLPPSATPAFEPSSETIARLEEAVAAAPSLKACRWQLAEAYWNSNDAVSAARTLAASPSWPENLAMLEFAGSVFLEADRAAAVDLFEEIVFQQPRHVGAHRALADLCREFGRADDAREHERAATAIIRNPIPEVVREPEPRVPGRVLPGVQRALARKNRESRSGAIAIALAVHALVILILAFWIIGGNRETSAELALGSGVEPSGGETGAGAQFVQSVQQKPEPLRRPAQSNVASVQLTPIAVQDLEPMEFDDDGAGMFGAPMVADAAPSNKRGGGGGAGGASLMFFGDRSTAERVVFIVDFSGSMRKGQRIQRLKGELYRSLAMLPEGLLYNIIYYADNAWLGKLASDADSRHPPQRVRWRVADGAGNRMTNMEVATMAPGGGTYWGPPLRLALGMDPKPDLIWLLTDGDAQDRESLVRKIDRMVVGDVRINTIGLELGGAPFKSLVEIAEKTGGSYSIIMQGRRHSGEAALQFTDPTYGPAEN